MLNNQKQHLRPRAVVGYGIKIFVPRSLHYFTRSPGWDLGQEWQNQPLTCTPEIKQHSKCSHTTLVFITWTLECVVLENIHAIPRGRGVAKAQLFGWKYEAIPIKCFVSHRSPSHEGGLVDWAKKGKELSVSEGQTARHESLATWSFRS